MPIDFQKKRVVAPNIPETLLPLGSSSPSFEVFPNLPSRRDPLFEAVRQLVIETGDPSVAHIQRRLKLGYRRADGMLAALEGEIVTVKDAHGWRSMMALGENEIHGSVVKLAIVDVETTGLDPTQDELITLSLVCVEVDGATGELLKVIDNYTGHREPTRSMSQAIEQMIGVSASDLAGQVLDVARITALLKGCELVIGHNAAFDRSFIEPHVPAFGKLAWGCSLRDIDWFGTEKQPKASIEHLAILYGIESSNGTPQADCNVLVRAMSMPLPVSGCTGFAALLASAHLPRYRYWIPGPGAENTALLQELGFMFDHEANAWSRVAGGVDAARLESELVNMAVFDGRFEQFRVEPVETPPET